LGLAEDAEIELLRIDFNAGIIYPFFMQGIGGDVMLSHALPPFSFTGEITVRLGLNVGNSLAPALLNPVGKFLPGEVEQLTLLHVGNLGLGDKPVNGRLGKPRDFSGKLNAADPVGFRLGRG
jgi:hypothetical protein